MAAKPKYLQVADILRREIAEGVFRDGDKLTTEEELRFRFRVSRQTVRQAIAQLEDDGLVDRRRGSGTYVRHGPRRRQGLLRVGVLTSYMTDYISPMILSPERIRRFLMVLTSCLQKSHSRMKNQACPDSGSTAW